MIKGNKSNNYINSHSINNNYDGRFIYVGHIFPHINFKTKAIMVLQKLYK